MHFASALTAVQLLWANIIMDTFAALAVGTGHGSRSPCNAQPQAGHFISPLSAPLFNVDMCNMITSQSIYQITKYIHICLYIFAYKE